MARASDSLESERLTSMGASDGHTESVENEILLRYHRNANVEATRKDLLQSLDSSRAIQDEVKAVYIITRH